MGADQEDWLPKPTSGSTELLPGQEPLRESRFLNEAILQQMEAYPTDGTYRVTPSSEMATSFGAINDISYLGQRRITGTESHGYCIGFIFELYMRSCERYAKAIFGNRNFRLDGLTGPEFTNFRRDFYGTDGERRTFVRTLVDRGLGMEIESLDDARPGDMIQFWRDGMESGHAVIFQEVDRDRGDRPSRLHYYSIGNMTNGIGFGSETITRGDGLSGSIDPEQIYIVRPYVPLPL